jgi:hypothetical protein
MPEATRSDNNLSKTATFLSVLIEDHTCSKFRSPEYTKKKKKEKKNTNRNPCFPISIFEHCYSELDLELLAVMDGEKREKEYDKRRV